MKKTLGTTAVVVALAAPFALGAQDQGGRGTGHMMQNGGGMMGQMGGMMQGDMAGMMSRIGAVMEACTEMMAAVSGTAEGGRADARAPDRPGG